MTIVVRDEADIVDEQIRFHLENDIDFILAVDHGSVDGTTDILRRYEREGCLKFTQKTDLAFSQSDWVTQMARLAATKFHADWVINSDADEFWMPRRGSLKDVLKAVPSRFGAIRGIWRHFVLRPEGSDPFYERMIVRRRPNDDVTSPYHVQVKTVHRAVADVVVSGGSHDANGRGLNLIREWYPFEVLHFPIRTRAQFERKYKAAWVGHDLDGSTSMPRHIEATASRLRSDGDDVYNAFLIDDESLVDGIANGTLFIDTRVRDELRIGVSSRQSPLSHADDAVLAEEIDMLLENDAARRLPLRASAFERRLEDVEHRHSTLQAP
jgi:hypothetical protein